MSTSTENTVTTAGARQPLGLKSYLGYAAGDAANNLSFSMAGMFLILYYTDVVGVSALVVGSMFGIVRMIDAFTDLVAGRIIDLKKPGRLGKFRPFILWFSLPLLLTSMAIFSVKALFPDISVGSAVIWMYVTYLLMGSVFYTLVNIAFGSMAPAMTQNPVERSKLATFRMYGAMLSMLAIAFVVAPQIRAAAGDPAALQQALLLTTGGFVVVGMALYLFMVFTTKEQVERPVVDKVSMGDTFRTLFTNRPLLILSLSAILFLTGMMALSTLGAYIAIQVIGDAQFIAWNQLAQTIPLFIIGPMIPKLVTTIGKRKAYILMGAMFVVGAAMLAFLPLTTTPWLGPLTFFVLGIGVSGVNALMWALEADCVDYGQWKTGYRTEGTTYAVFSFTRKLGQAAGGLVGAAALTWAAYDEGRASTGLGQLPGVAENIQLYGAAVMAGFGLLSLIVMAFYPLTETRYAEITAELAERTATERAGA